MEFSGQLITQARDEFNIWNIQGDIWTRTSHIMHLPEPGTP